MFQLAATLSLETGEFNRGLEDGRRRLSVYRHDVASLANEYRQQGMASSDAWKRAYQEIDKSEYGFVRESQDRWNETGGVIQKVSGTVSAGAVALGHLLADVAKKGAQMVVDLGKTGISYNAQMQDYTASFKTMLGSTEAAAAKVEALKEFAAKTPFEMTDLAQATQTLLAFGIEADKTDGIMKMLGDVSLGNSQKFASLATVFGQVSSTGKLMGQDLLQFINQGFNPLQVIAEKTGASMGDLKKVMSGEKTSREFQKMIKAAQKEVKKMGDNASESAKLLAQIGTDGAISAEMVEEAFRIATSEGGQFYNGMEESSKTLNGLFSTLSDNWTSLVGDVFKPASDFLQTTLLPKAIEGVEKLSEAYNENGLKGMLGAAADLIAPYVSKAFAALSNMADNAVTTGANILAGIYNGLTGSEITADDVSSKFSEFFSGADSFIDGMIKKGGGIIASIYEALTKDSETAKKIEAMFSDVFSGASLGEVVSKAQTFFTDVLAALGGDSAAQDRVKEKFDEFGGYLAPLEHAFSNINSFVTDVFNWILQNGEAVATILGSIAIAFVTMSAIADPIGTILKLIPVVFATIILYWEEFKTVMEPVLPLFQFLLDVIAAIGGAVVDATVWLFNFVTITIPDAFTKAMKWISDTWAAISGAVGSAWQSLTDFLASVIPEPLLEAFRTIRDIWEKIYTYISNAYNYVKKFSDFKYFNLLSLATGGSFAVGLDYVPKDNFPANLHRGEAVLTRSEAEEWRAGKDGKGTTINVYQSIYSEAKTAADLMREARWEQERGVMMGHVYG